MADEDQSAFINAEGLTEAPFAKGTLVDVITKHGEQINAELVEHFHWGKHHCTVAKYRRHTPAYAIRDYLAAMDEEMILLDPPEMYDRAILGTTDTDGGTRAAYSVTKILEILHKEQGMEDPLEAYEFYAFNIQPLTHMPQGPVFIEGVDL